MLRIAPPIIHKFGTSVTQMGLKQANRVNVSRVRPMCSTTPAQTNEVLAMKDQIHRLELGIVGVESRLTEKFTKEISGVESRLTEKFTKEISGVESRLNEKIVGVESRLTEKFTKEISGVESRLTEKIVGLNEKMETNQTAILLAIKGQDVKFEQMNTKHETLKNQILKIVGSLITFAIGYANRDRLLQSLPGLFK